MTFKVSYHHSIFTFWLLDKQKKENVLIHNCDVDLKGLDLYQPYVQQGRDLIMSNKSYMLEKKVSTFAFSFEDFFVWNLLLFS